MRQRDELRTFSLETGVQLHADGSCLVRMGDTHVLCAASLEERLPAWLKGRGFTCTVSHSNCFMIDVKRPAEQVIEQLAARNVLVGRVWQDWPQWVRVTVGNEQEMERFREAFAAQV